LAALGAGPAAAAGLSAGFFLASGLGAAAAAAAGAAFFSSFAEIEIQNM
jgi:hypothetical protein